MSYWTLAMGELNAAKEIEKAVRCGPPAESQLAQEMVLLAWQALGPAGVLDDQVAMRRLRAMGDTVAVRRQVRRDRDLELFGR